MLFARAQRGAGERVSKPPMDRNQHEFRRRHRASSAPNCKRDEWWVCSRGVARVSRTSCSYYHQASSRFSAKMRGTAVPKTDRRGSVQPNGCAWLAAQAQLRGGGSAAPGLLGSFVVSAFSRLCGDENPVLRDYAQHGWRSPCARDGPQYDMHLSPSRGISPALIPEAGEPTPDWETVCGMCRIDRTPSVLETTEFIFASCLAPAATR